MTKLKPRGFTLLELIVGVAVVSILTTMAYGSYKRHGLKSEAAMIQNEIGLVALDLEKYKSKNFSYQGYPIYEKNYPNYVIQVVDTQTEQSLSESESGGVSWAIRGASLKGDNYNFLMSSSGVSCKNKDAHLVSFKGCGTKDEGYETW